VVEQVFGVSKPKRGDAVAKTNAMRKLDTAGVEYDVCSYEIEDEMSAGLGVRMAQQTGHDVDYTFKTLVCRTPAGSFVVFCLPVARQLDLKKAARAAGAKAVSMVAVRDITAATGYVRGGCSPVGMKRDYPTFIDETARLHERIYVSGGHVGVSLHLSPEDLARVTGASFVDLLAE
jgi:Cys-tRNA(Pro)/Cys-tRNA(Cys) deacylase